MSADRVDVERTFGVGEGAALPDLERIPGVASVTGPVHHLLEATSYDTPALALAAAGVTLRRRTGGDDAGWHLRLPPADAGREVRVPLGRAVRTAPKRLRSLVMAVVRDQPLSPVVTMRTDRDVWRLLDASGRTLAQLCDDRVRAQSHSDDADAATWRQWEVELVDGDRQTLRSVARHLRRAGAQPADTSSELARVLGHRIPEPADGRPPRPRPNAPVSRLVQTRLVEQVAELKHQDPLVRYDAPDAVHKMRVAVRRLSSALATLRPFLDRGAAEPLREDLKWLARLLGAARDAEVQRARLQERLAAYRAPLRGRVDRHLRDEYDRAHATAVAAMETGRYLALLDGLDGLAVHPPWTEEAQRPVREMMPGPLRREWKRLERRMGPALAAEDSAERGALLHAARRAAKRTRYALEPLVTTYGKDPGSTLKAVKNLQRVLGDHQDGVVTRRLLQDLPGRLDLDPVESFDLGTLHAREEVSAEAAVRATGKAWKAVRKARPRRLLS